MEQGENTVRAPLMVTEMAEMEATVEDIAGMMDRLLGRLECVMRSAGGSGQDLQPEREPILPPLIVRQRQTRELLENVAHNLTGILDRLEI